MNAWIVPVLASLSTIMVVAIIYITNTLRHKQRMTLLEKGLPPDYFSRDNLLSWLRLGALLIGAGVGFLLAFLIDLNLFNMENGSEPLYPSLVAICAGIAIFISKKLK